MKKLSAILVTLAVVFAATSAFAQPQVTVHVTGGYNLPMSPFKGTVGTDSNSYFMKSGFSIGADGKYFLGKKRNVGITLSLGYNAFSSGDVVLFTGSSNTFKSKINIFTAGLGVEYDFMPKGKANPFIGAEFTGNFFSGKTTITTATTTDSSLGTLTSASRFGAQVNAGVDFTISKSIGAVIGIRYNLANLIGKKFDTTSTTAGEYPLDDAANGSGSISSKSISYLQFYGGVSFYFNRPKMMRKK